MKGLPNLGKKAIFRQPIKKRMEFSYNPNLRPLTHFAIYTCGRQSLLNQYMSFVSNAEPGGLYWSLLYAHAEDMADKFAERIAVEELENAPCLHLRTQDLFGSNEVQKALGGVLAAIRQGLLPYCKYTIPAKTAGPHDYFSALAAQGIDRLLVTFTIDLEELRHAGTSKRMLVHFTALHEWLAGQLPAGKIDLHLMLQIEGEREWATVKDLYAPFAQIGSPMMDLGALEYIEREDLELWMQREMHVQDATSRRRLLRRYFPSFTRMRMRKVAARLRQLTLAYNTSIK